VLEEIWGKTLSSPQPKHAVDSHVLPSGEYKIRNKEWFRLLLNYVGPIGKQCACACVWGGWCRWQVRYNGVGGLVSLLGYVWCWTASPQTTISQSDGRRKHVRPARHGVRKLHRY